MRNERESLGSGDESVSLRGIQTELEFICPMGRQR